MILSEEGKKEKVGISTVKPARDRKTTMERPRSKPCAPLKTRRGVARLGAQLAPRLGAAGAHGALGPPGQRPHRRGAAGLRSEDAPLGAGEKWTRETTGSPSSAL